MAVEIAETTANLLNTLRSQAESRRMSLDSYLAQIVAANDQASANGSLTLDEFDKVLDDLAQSGATATLPADFSRSDIYADHN
jgi:hypothetical protein